MSNKFKLKKGDEVLVLAGKDKGKTGKIIKMIPRDSKAIVADINKVKKHQKPVIMMQVELLKKKCLFTSLISLIMKVRQRKL